MLVDKILTVTWNFLIVGRAMPALLKNKRKIVSVSATNSCRRV